MNTSPYLKTKALLQIFLVVTLSIITSLSLKSTLVSAEPTSCCQKTKEPNSQYCVENIPEDQCAAGAYSSTSCSLTAGCGQTGCCVTQDNQCSSATTKTSCDASNGQFNPGVSCPSLDVCKPTCCVTGNNCNIQTAYACAADNGEVHAELGTEQACTNYCAQNDQGCCSDDCKYGIGTTCSAGNFYKGTQCSKVTACKQQCTPKDHKQCGDDGNVYWYDSCGNQEETFDTCDPDGKKGPSRECLAQENGDVSCQQTACTNVWDNNVVDENNDGNLKDEGLTRQNLDSWCEYQAAVGPTLDLPGTQHYRHYCERGKEKVDPCGPDRERICIYGAATFSPTQDKAIGVCAKNNWEECQQSNDQNSCEDPQKTCTWVSYSQETAYKKEGTKIKLTLPVAYNTEEEGIIVQGELKDAINKDEIKQTKLKIRGPTSIDLSFSTAKKIPQGNLDIYSFETSVDPGDYWIRACYDEEGETPKCENLLKTTITAESLSELTAGKGDCFPLVPPESTSQCKETNTKLYYKEASYWEEACYEEEWTCDVDGGGCDVYKEDFKKGTNAKCNAYGNCGAKYNLAQKFSSKGYRRDCSPNNANYPGIETQCPTGSGAISPGLILFDTYKNAGNGLNLLNVDFTKVGETLGQGVNTPTILAIISGSTAVVLPGIFVATALVSSIIYGAEIAIFGVGVVLGPPGWIAVAIISAVLLTTTYLLATCAPDEKRDIAAMCGAWEAPTGGEDCWKCNTPKNAGGLLPDEFAFNYTGTGDLPQYECTPQLCASLGTYCQHIPDTPQGPQCVGVQPNDIIGPELKVTDIKYACNDQPPGAVGNCAVNQEGKVEITGDLKEFSSVNITLTSTNPETTKDEIADCRYAPTRASFDEMTSFEEGDFASLTHTLAIKNIGQNKEHTYYVQCQDVSAQHNLMRDYYTITFHAAQQPDKTPPTIVRFIPDQTKAYAPAGSVTFDMALETNEEVPLGSASGCRWEDKSNVAFANMIHTMRCASPTNNEGPTCTATLPITKPENTFAFKCTDLEKNTMQQDIFYTVKQSQPLLLDSVQCATLFNNECLPTMYGDEINITLQTSDGFEHGKAICDYQLDRGNSIEFFTTNAQEHQQPGIKPALPGKHALTFYCNDAIGNTVNQTITFELIKDTTAPHILTGAVTNNLLSIRTDEKARCAYNTTLPATTYTPFTITDAFAHATPLDNTNFFTIRCQDPFQNIGSLTRITIL